MVLSPGLRPLLLSISLLLACGPAAPGVAESGGTLTGGDLERLVVEVVAEYPHDPRAFTQGLLWYEGALYESTGQYGTSALRRVDPWTGTVMAEKRLDPQLFGEGLERVGQRLIQLTWQAGLATVYDLESLEPLKRFEYQGEGWGLAYDGQALMMSDGTSTLTFRDAESFAVLQRREVRLYDKPLTQLNELEFAAGDLYANIWGQDWIARIEPASGRVTAMIDASGLLTPRERLRTDVLNGIAYDPDSKTFWITGKYWPKIFQVRFRDRRASPAGGAPGGGDAARRAPPPPPSSR